MSAWIVLVPALPLAAALLACSRRLRGWVTALAPLALLPALGAALAPAEKTLKLDWLLLGTTLGLDATGRIFLFFSALAWLLAAVYARAWLANDPGRARFFGFFLASAAGNLGVCVAQDAVSFYFFFALMTFSAYGMILHRDGAAARRAGAVYLVLAVIGEAALLVALLLVVAEGGLALAAAPAAVAASAWRDTIVALLLVGFGVKIGVLGLHVALPLVYGAAPAPGAAVLASAMIKAGLLGWLRFLPLGHALPEWSWIFIALGLAAAFYGVVIGLMQREPKVILAYSSISQMGLITVGVGFGMAAPGAGAPALYAVTLYALHHALAKGALFLGEGVSRAAHGRPRIWVFAGLALLALALAGAPLTSGALAKHALKDLLTFAPSPHGLAIVLNLASVGTTLLVARFLWQVWHDPRAARAQRSGLLLPWLAMLAAVLALAWIVAPMDRSATLSPAALAGAVWPVALGALAAIAAARYLRARRLSVPSGDVLTLIETAGARAARWAGRMFDAARIKGLPRLAAGFRLASARLPVVNAVAWETRLRAGPVFGVLSLALALALAALVAFA